LPHGVTSEPLSGKGLVITLLKDNSIYLGARKTSLLELKKIFLSSSPSFLKKEVLSSSSVANECFSVLIKADRAASVGALVCLWDMLKEAAAAKVYIVTNE
jgi:biopolymer transport protein ExbD